MLPTEGLRGDPRLLLCLRSHQGLLGNVTCILTQLKTALVGGTVPWERLWAEGLHWYHILTVVTSYAGYLQTALPQPVLQACTPQPQKGEFTQDHSSQGMPGECLRASEPLLLCYFVDGSLPCLRLSCLMPPLAPTRYHLSLRLGSIFSLHLHTLSQLGSSPITRHDYA